MKVAFGRMEHGFCLKFDNGVKLSTMFGQHHFCDNHNSFVETLRKKTHERIQDLKKSKKEFLEKFFDRRYSRQSN